MGSKPMGPGGLFTLTDRTRRAIPGWISTRPIIHPVPLHPIPPVPCPQGKIYYRWPLRPGRKVSNDSIQSGSKTGPDLGHHPNFSLKKSMVRFQANSAATLSYLGVEVLWNPWFASG